MCKIHQFEPQPAQPAVPAPIRAPSPAALRQIAEWKRMAEGPKLWPWPRALAVVCGAVAVGVAAGRMASAMGWTVALPFAT